MADEHGKRKLLTYRALYRLNRAFARVVRNLNQLHSAQVFKDDIPDEGQPRYWQESLAEIQGEINRRLTQNLHNMEHGDVRRLGRVVEMAPRVRELLYGTEKDDDGDGSTTPKREHRKPRRSKMSRKR